MFKHYRRIDECSSPGMVFDEEGSYVYFDEAKQVMDERDAALKEVESLRLHLKMARSILGEEGLLPELADRIKGAS